MEIQLYTKKEAKEIIKKYPNRKLRTKQAVVGIEEDIEKDHWECSPYTEKRMFYIIERVYYPGKRFDKIFIEPQKLAKNGVYFQLVRKYRWGGSEIVDDYYTDVDDLRADMVFFENYHANDFAYIVGRKVVIDEKTGKETTEVLWTFGSFEDLWWLKEEQEKVLKMAIG